MALVDAGDAGGAGKAGAAGGAGLASVPAPGVSSNFQFSVSGGTQHLIKGLQATIGLRMYETWLMSRVMKVDAGSAIRPVSASSMSARIPYSVAEDVPAAVAEAAARSSLTSATFGLFNPTFQTFRTLQTVSNELMSDAKVMEILAYQFAMNLAEQTQAYLLGIIGASVVGTTRHHFNPNGGSVGTTDGVPHFKVLSALVSGTPSAADWAAATRGGIAVDTAMFTATERQMLVMSSHPSALTNFLFSSSSGAVTNNVHLTISNDVQHPGCMNPIMGIPWYTDASLPVPSAVAATVSSTPHVLIFNPAQVMLAVKSPVVVTLDTESLMESNQTVVHATYRAAGAMMNPKSAAAYSLKTLPAT